MSLLFPRGYNFMNQEKYAISTIVHKLNKDINNYFLQQYIMLSLSNLTIENYG